MSNNAPLYDPTRSWQIFNYNDIYSGPTGTGVIVPNVGDQVRKIVGNVATDYVVESVALGSLISTLVPLVIGNNTANTLNMDTLFGDTPNTYAIYIDKSVVPFALNVDARLELKGSMITSCKIFQGSDISPAGNVISAVYDASGNYVGENVGLSLVASDAYNNNVAVKVINPCNTSANLLDGELVTVVCYNVSGNVVSESKLYVHNTGFVRPVNAANKTVINIGLISPFLSSTNSSVINYPLNLQMNVANLIGVVYYSDGSSNAMPVDGVKFIVDGLSAYTSTNVGQSYSIVANYVLQPGEAACGVNNTNVPHISRAYSLITSPANLNYQIQLFAYPVWKSSSASYTLEWFMYDMVRSHAFDVTNYITFAPGSTFNGTLYGSKQTVTAQLNLSSVSQIYNSFNYSQAIDVMLEAPGTFRQNATTPPNWYVTPVSGTMPMFGAGAFATYLVNGPNNTTLSLAGTYTSQATWLAAYYNNTLPMTIAGVETAPPTPTHFTLVINGASTTYPISSWNAAIVTAQTVTQNSTLFIQFIQRTALADLQLSVAGVPMYQINSSGAYL